MKIKLGLLVLGLVTLLGSMLASSQRIAAYQVTILASSAPRGPALLGEGSGSSSGDVIPPVCLWTCLTYLPVVVNIPGGIAGYLTQGGAPVGGISLELRRDNGSSISIIAATTTDASGYYEFTAVPSLNSGQSYFVRYGNPERNDSRVGAWVSSDVESYVSGASVDLGIGDLANVPLVAPGSGAVVALPYLFQWTPRPATHSDSYILVIADRADLDPLGLTWWLGYVNSHSLSSLSSVFGVGALTPGVEYSWWVMAWEPGGSAGMSYYYHQITFTNTGLDKAGTGGRALPKNLHYERLGVPRLKQ